MNVRHAVPSSGTLDMLKSPGARIQILAKTQRCAQNRADIPSNASAGL